MKFVKHSGFRPRGRVAAKTPSTWVTTTAVMRCRNDSSASGTTSFKRFAEKIEQLGSYGGGNHFGEC